MILAAMDTLVYGAEMFSTTKRRQFQVRLTRAQETATTWSAADCQTAIERLEHEINPVQTVKRKRFNELFQYYDLQLL